jgi:hypothetical protein
MDNETSLAVVKNKKANENIAGFYALPRGRYMYHCKW